MATTEDAEESNHWRDVMRTLLLYSDFVADDLHRRQEHLNRVKDSWAKRLPDVTFTKLEGIEHASHANQQFLDEIVDFQSDGQSPHPHVGLKIGYAQQHRNQAILHSFYREWSEEGASERAQSFGPLIEELQRLLPVSESNAYQQRVLVPGSGLGRLPLEIASKGYQSQGNEFSAFMAMASNFVTGTGVTVAASNASNGTVAWNIPANTIIGLNWAPWLISGSTAIYLTNGTYLSSTLTAPNLTVNSTGTINTVVGTLPQITGTYSPPIINTVTPSPGYTTQLVTIAGYNLPTTGVTGTIGGSLLTNISYTSSGITGLIPNLSAGSYSLYITTPAGQSNSLPFQVLVSPIVTRTYTLNNVGGAWSRANGAFVGYYPLTSAVGVQGNVTQISVNFSTNVKSNFTNGCFAFLFNKVPPAGQSNAGNFGGWQPLFGSPYSLLNFQATIDITPYAVNTSDPIYLQLWAYWSYDSIILTTATVTLTILQT